MGLQAFLTVVVYPDRPANAQSPGVPTDRGSLPEFEVASVKPTDLSKDVLVRVRIYPGGRVEIPGSKLAGLIYLAFLPYDLSGGDDWIYQIPLYDVIALPPKSLQDTVTDLHSNPWIGDERLRQMLQALLIRRFQLRFHYEAKEGDVYFLRTAKQPVAAEPTKTAISYSSSSTREPISGGPGRFRLRGATMAELAFWLSRRLKAPVLNETGLDGAYDYEQRNTAVDPEHRQEYDESCMSFIREIHLSIVKGQGQVQRLVISSAQKPLEN